MKLDLTKPVETRDGRKARIICTDFKRENRPILAAIADHNGIESTDYFWENGQLYGCSDEPGDLVNIKEKHEVWINIYPNNSAHVDRSRDRADYHAADNRTACIKITYEDGQFDE